MAELLDLYQSIIVDHNRNPRHYGCGSADTRSEEGYNPTCGDHITLHLRIEQDTLAELTFEAASCAIAKASASLMCTVLQGKSIAEFQDCHVQIQALLEVVYNENDARFSQLGKLSALAGVRAFPARKNCALLPWSTLHRALA